MEKETSEKWGNFETREDMEVALTVFNADRNLFYAMFSTNPFPVPSVVRGQLNPHSPYRLYEEGRNGQVYYDSQKEQEWELNQGALTMVGPSTGSGTTLVPMEERAVRPPIITIAPRAVADETIPDRSEEPSLPVIQNARHRTRWAALCILIPAGIVAAGTVATAATYAGLRSQGYEVKVEIEPWWGESKK